MLIVRLLLLFFNCSLLFFCLFFGLYVDRKVVVDSFFFCLYFGLYGAIVLLSLLNCCLLSKNKPLNLFFFPG